MQAFRAAIYSIVAANQPCSVRQIYYRGIGLHWDKDQGSTGANYKRVVRELGLMRENDELPWNWITDSTRYVRRDTMYDSHLDALQRTAEFYRRDLWSKQPRRVEVWCESDSISGVLDPVTRALGVGLYSCRGQSPKTFVKDATDTYMAIGKPVTILYVGDWDPTGLAIPRSVEQRVVRYSGGTVDLDFRRLAVTADDIMSMNLVTHGVNRNDSNYQRYVQECELVGLDPQVSVEVEAIPSTVLRDRLEAELYDLVEDAETWNATLAAEESERNILTAMAEGR